MIVINGGGGGNVRIAGRLSAKGHHLANGGSIAVSGAAIAATGKLAANGAGGGTISIIGGSELALAGTLLAQGYSGQGGEIDLTAGNVSLTGATVNASGATGGGTINIGGDEHGSGPLANALTIYVNATTIVRADATQNGNGGSIVVWSDQATTFAGSSNTRGGPQGGNGGFVEVSGGVLSLTGAIDVSAPLGSLGTILLDPTNLTIIAGNSGSGDQDAALIAGSGTVAYNAADTTNDQVSNGAIQSLTGNIVLQATNNITVSAPINLTTAGQALTMQAGNNLVVQSGASITTKGNITLSAADSTIPGFSASGGLTLGATLSTSASAGTVKLSAGTGGIGLNGDVGATTLNLVSAGAISQTGGTITAGTLTGSATSASLTQGPNPIGTLGAFTTTAGFALVDNEALTVTGPVKDTGASSTLALATETGGITLFGNVSAKNVLDLSSAEGISQLSGAISAATLQSSSGVAKTVSLTSTTNNIGAVGSFTVGSGDFTLVDNGNTGNLQLSGPLSAANVTISNANTGAISVSGSISATTALTLSSGSGGIGLNTGSALSGATVDLSTTGGGVTQVASGTITASTVLQSTSGVTGTVNLAGTANNIAAVGSFAVSSGDFTLADNGNTGNLQLSGPLSAANVTISNANTGTIRVSGSISATTALTLSSGKGGIGLKTGSALSGATVDLSTTGGGVTQVASGTITASTVLQSTSGVTGTVNLAGTANNIAAVGSFAVSSGDFTLVDNGNTGNLQLSGPLSAANVTISNANTGAISVSGSISATSALTLSSGSGGIGLNTGSALSGATVDLSTTGGGVTQVASGTITASTILQSTSGVTGTVNLAGTANNIAAVGSFSVSSGSFSLTDSVTTLAINGPISVSAGSLSFVNTDGAINVETPLTVAGSNTLTLTASGTLAIDQALTVGGALTVSAGGAITATAGVSAGVFILQAGAWTQNTPNLPAFSATDFRISGGSFLRVTAGDGSSGNPYQIADVYGLQGIGTYLSSNFKLANDIDASGTVNWNSGAGFVPIGNLATTFTGSFDGQNHAIKNLSINLPSTTYVGLFGFAGSGSTLSNVTLSGGSIVGGGTVGSLAGAADGTVSNVSSSVNVTGVFDSTLTSGFFVGGLIGSFAGPTLSNASASGSVSGNALVGGLTGSTSSVSALTNVHATGAVSGVSDVGGLVGDNSGSVNQAYATGTVTGASPNPSASVSWVGGLIGLNQTTGSVSNSFATGDVSASSNAAGTAEAIGGLIGQNQGTVTTSYATGAVLGGSDVGGLVGANINVGVVPTITQSYATGAVTGIFAIGGLVGGNYGGTISATYATGQVVASGNFLGVLFGNVGGLVGDNGEAGSGGSIINSYATGSVIGPANVGGLVGFNEAGATIASSYATGAVYGQSQVGGLIGNNGGTIVGGYWDTQTSGTSVGIGAGTTTGAGADATGLTTAQFGTASNMPGLTFGTTPGGSGWVIIDADGTLNNAGGAAGATRPFLLSEYTTNVVNAHQLQLVALAPTVNYTLGSDIDLAPSLADPAQMWTTSGFVPLGNTATPFSGAFNGQGNYIAGLTINMPTTDHVGLFASVTGAVSNLGLIQATVTGQNFVGALAGSVDGGAVTNTYALATVTGASNTGGLVGWNLGTITQSYSSGAVSAGGQVGGLAGRNDGAISFSYSTAAVTGTTDVGGLVGYNVSNGPGTGTITQTWASGLVIGANSVGGLVGHNASNGNVTQSYWDTDTTGQPSAIGLDEGTSSQLASVNSSTAYSQASYANFDFNTGGWFMIDGQTRPFLQSEFNTQIATPHQLQLMAMNLSANYTLVSDIDFGSAYANPSEMWNVAGFVPIGTLVAPFTGTFNGQNNVIDGLFVNRPTTDYVGLFGYARDATISNVGLTNLLVVGANNVGGLVGYLDGHSGGVGPISSSDQVTVTNSFVSGDVFGQSNVGGLIGWLDGDNGGSATVSQSYSTGTVTGLGMNPASPLYPFSEVGGLVGLSDGSGGGHVTITQSYSSSTVTGAANNSDIGGLVGDNLSAGGSAIISYSYGLGAVRGGLGGDYVGGLVGYNDVNSSIIQSYATGAVSADFLATNVGGLAGGNAGTITASAWDTTTTNRLFAVGLGSAAGTSFAVQSNNPAGPNYAYSQSTYTAQGWDFTSGNSATGWYMVDGQTRPFGQWEYSTTIRNSHQLELIGMNAVTLEANYTLANDIDLGPDLANPSSMWSSAGFVPIGTGDINVPAFTGAFDGQNHTISNLFISQTSGSNFVGLFGSIGSGGVVFNVGVKNADVTAPAFVGALAGDNQGVVFNAYSTGWVTGFITVGGLLGDLGGMAVNSYSAATIVGEIVPGSTSSGNPSWIGGLVGQVVGGAVINSHATGAVVAFDGDYVGGLIGSTNVGVTVSNSYATGNVFAPQITNGGVSIGGLIGDSYDAVTNSYATGNVTGEQFVGGLIGSAEGYSVVTRSFATGSVAGDANSLSLGGLIGYNNGISVTDAYATGAVIGSGNNLGGLGGLIGDNFANLTNVYSTGLVALADPSSLNPSTQIGALLGSNTFGTLTNAYWNSDTAGPWQGVGPSSFPTNATPLTTAQLQAGPVTALGFDPAVWGNIPGISYPYLNWRFPNGPTVVSGTAVGTPGGSDVIPGQFVYLALNGNVVEQTVTGANGYYNIMTDPPASGAGTPVLTFLGYSFINPGPGSFVGSNVVTTLTAQGTMGVHATGLELAANRVLVISDQPTMAGPNGIISLMAAAEQNVFIGPNILYAACGCGTLLSSLAFSRTSGSKAMPPR